MSRWSCIRHALAGGITLALAQFVAPPSFAAEPVDLELILAVDVSLSMSPGELEIQRRGYAAALMHDDVIQAIRDGVHGKIAVTFFEWAGATTQRVVVPWTTISSLEDAERVVLQLSAKPPSSARRTSISGALEFGNDLFAESGYRGTRRVIDVSGDGPNNQGASVEGARDALIAKGVTINGLPLMTNGGFTSVYDIADLDRYYAECVIGGPGAFMIAVNDWPQFPEAVRRKLVLELAGNSPDDAVRSEDTNSLPVVLAQAKGSYDCLVGEKLWRDRSWMMNSR
ncbi:DUF1194 domain-containing protein [Pseudaminobacter sp. NGMCC 1.201702]|uniref:DUF1194 domain-containing protein n=1 Tax=Pseudaminobacter sp. NGMCC 1.201702 TaxID=3391825 RepID=UPI0039F02F6A